MIGRLSWNRRRLLAASMAAIASPVVATAQPAAKPRRLAIVVRAGAGSDIDRPSLRHWHAWQQELLRLGYVEGQNLTVDRWTAEGDPAHIGHMLQELASRKPDLIFSPAQNAVDVIKAVAIDIPVIAVVVDPVGSGFATSLARPGGSITGFSLDAGLETLAKRFALLKEIAPSVSRIGILGSRFALEGRFAAVMREAAAMAGMTAVAAGFDPPASEAEFRRLFASMRRDGADCFYATVAPEHLVYRSIMAQLALATKLPGIHTYRESVESGGLIAYAIDLADIFRAAAGYADRIFRGAKAGELPFQQPTRFVLTLNLGTARALGLDVPASLLARADEVIE